jgi:hypothetical protein
MVFIVAVIAGSPLAGSHANSGRLPGTDSQRAYDALARSFLQRHRDEGQIVFSDVRRDRAAIDACLAAVAWEPGAATRTGRDRPSWTCRHCRQRRPPVTSGGRHQLARPRDTSTGHVQDTRLRMHSSKAIFRALIDGAANSPRRVRIPQPHTAKPIDLKSIVRS